MDVATLRCTVHHDDALTPTGAGALTPTGAGALSGVARGGGLPVFKARVLQ